MNIGDWIKDNSTHILTGFAVTGVVGTVVLAVKATPQVWNDIRAEEEYQARLLELPDDETYTASFKEQFKIAWKPYLPAFITGACTITAIIGSHAIGQKKQSALAAGIALTQRAYQEYKEGTLEIVGEKKEEEIRAKVSENSLNRQMETRQLQILDSVEGQQLCYDRFSGRVFYSDREGIRKAENDIIAGINNFEYASLNDFWRRIGLEETDAGEVLGFNSTYPLSIEFSSYLVGGNRPALAIDFHHSPVPNFHKEGPWR